MEVYADPITVNCRKVLAGLQLMGIDYNLNKVDYFQSEQKGPSYVAINPNAALPAMRDDGLTLWESNAILQYAADKHGKTAFYPTDTKTRADINRWLFWECGAWFPSCYTFLVENCVKPLLGGPPIRRSLKRKSQTSTSLPASSMSGLPTANGSAATARQLRTFPLRRRSTSTNGRSCHSASISI